MATDMSNYGWLVDRFADNTRGVSHAAVVSADGILLTASRKLPAERADQLSAIAAGLSSLTEGASRCFDGGSVRHTMIGMDRGWVVLMSISDGSSLIVLAEPACDIGFVAYEMTILVERVGFSLTPGTRLAAVNSEAEVAPRALGQHPSAR